MNVLKRHHNSSETAGVVIHNMAWVYDLGCYLVGMGLRFRRNTIQLAQLKSGERVLDVGCGTGVLTRLVAEEVGNEGEVMADRNSSEWRHDQCGAWIKRDAYEQEHSDYGWTIRNMMPGENEKLEGMHPFHYQNVYDLASNKPQCKVTADRTGIQPTQQIDDPRNKPV